MPSFVWDYFTKKGAKTNQAECNQAGCFKKLSYAKGTSSLIHHLKTAHNIINEPDSAKRPDEANQETKQQKKISDFLKKPTIEEEVARMVAESNLTFNQIATTKFIRLSLAAKYPHNIFPQDHAGISRLMMKYLKSYFTNKK